MSWGARDPRGEPAARAVTAAPSPPIADELNRFGRMRLKRHNIEYGAQRAGEAEVRADLQHARAIVDAIAKVA